MFRRSITSDLYAPKNIADQVDSGSLGLQKEWWPVILHNWQKYQLPLTGGAFAVVLSSVLVLDFSDSRSTKTDSGIAAGSQKPRSQTT